MRLLTLISTAILYTAISTVNAGTLNNGQWTPSECGEIPEPESLDTSNGIDAYNESVKKVNEWQQLAQAYLSCFINEANADNTTISKIATEEQNKFRTIFDKIKADAAAAKFNKKQP